MDNEKKILGIIKETAKAYIPDAEVILFGSRARHEADVNSDFDILIITNLKLTPKEKLPIRTSIRKALLLSNIRSDILIQSKMEINKKKMLPGHMIRSILKDAIIL